MCPDHETFWTLLHDAAHWEFEIFLMILFDGIIFGLVWRLIRKYVRFFNGHMQHHQCPPEEKQTPKT